MSWLQNGQLFPNLNLPAVGGGALDLPRDLAGSYGVVLIYRGHWCPFCNEQMMAFSQAAVALEAAGAKVVAFSVDNEVEAHAFVAKHHIPFPVGHSTKIDEVVQATGAYQNEAPGRGRFLESTGFVLAPDGTVDAAVYASRAIGRLVPDDVIRLITFMTSQRKLS